MSLCWNQGYEHFSDVQNHQEFYTEMKESVKFTVYGYKESSIRKILSHCVSVLLLGIPYLLFATFLKLKILNYKKCLLEDATHVFLYDAHGNVSFTTVQIDSIILPKMTSPVEIKSFSFQNTKYIWQEEQKMYSAIVDYLHPLVLDENLLKPRGLTEEEVENRLKLFGPNVIEIEVKSYWRLFVDEVMNPFYLFQGFSVILWFIDEYYSYATCVLLLTLVSSVFALFQTRAQNEALHEMVESSRCPSATVIREIRSKQTILIVNPSEIVPGDVLVLPSMNYTLPCDAVLLNGQCIVNECILTGESVPIMKTPADDSMGNYNLEIHKNVTLFCGTLLIQTRYYGREKVLAKVIHTGFETTKGSLVNSILFSGTIGVKFYRDSFKFVLFLSVVAALGMAYCIYLYTNRDPGDIKEMIVRTLDIVTIIVPPTLPAAIAAGIIYSYERLKKLGIYCISRNKINVCGEINLACFDKTGTLTDEGLVMSKVIPCKNRIFCDPVSVVRRLHEHTELLNAMATCHSLTRINNVLNGDPIDLEMFKYTGWELEEPGDIETSRYDMLGPIVINGTYETPETKIPVCIGILRQFTFCPVFQCMSVICRNLANTNLMVYTKGAPEKIKAICKSSTIPQDFYNQLSQYSSQGFRLIAISYKNLPPTFTWKDAQQCDREIVECDLTFLGFLILQNPLKPETAPVIRTLHSANMRTVMITGDNLLTAISVAYNCEMVKPQEDVYNLVVDITPNTRPLIKLERAIGQHEDIDEVSSLDDYHFAIDGTNWALLMTLLPHLIPLLLIRMTIFARIRPDQKTEIIKEFQKIDYVVCMVGDGANDCGALKAAHVGVSLSHAEASVAAPFTSSIQNISCIIHLLLEGRCALVTSFSVFNFMALYSFIQFFSVIILYKERSNLGDYQFFYIDFFIITLLALTIGNQGPSDILVPQNPLSSLISPRNIIPLLLQIGVCALMQIGALYFLYKQPWFVPIPDAHVSNSVVVSWENTVIFNISCYQYLIIATVYSKGKPYRRHLITNGWFILSNVVLAVTSSWLMLYPCDEMAKFMQLMIVHPDDNDKFLFRFYLVVFPIVHFIWAFLIEIGITDRMWLHRFIQFLTRDKRSVKKFSTLILNTEYESWVDFSGVRNSY